MADETIVSRRVNLGDWQFDPGLMMNIALIAWLYARGLARLRESMKTRVAFSKVNLFGFLIGLLILVGCLSSPLDALSSQFASTHMVQHMTIMTIATTAWYPYYKGITELWGLSALEDQQLAGLIMWMPACAAYAFCAI